MIMTVLFVSIRLDCAEVPQCLTNGKGAALSLSRMLSDLTFTLNLRKSTLLVHGTQATKLPQMTLFLLFFGESSQLSQNKMPFLVLARKLVSPCTDLKLTNTRPKFRIQTGASQTFG